MTNDSLSRTPEELSREIRKLEARLEDFLKDEEDFVKELRSCLEKLKKLYETINRLEMRPDSEKVKGLMNLRMEVTKALSETLRKESKAEHEKSHLLESYGALILALEQEFQKLCSPM
jgi:chromosome segregation ATPase